MPEIYSGIQNEPEGTRTPDTRFRKPLLYPTELLVHGRKLPAFIILYFHTICKGFFQKFQRGRKLSFFENFLSLNRFFFTVFCCNYYCFCSKMCYNNSVVITDTNQMKEVLIMNPRKAAIIGCGFVGSATAFTLMQSRLFSEIVLIDANYDKADGEAKDIAHGIPFAGQMKIYAGDFLSLYFKMTYFPLLSHFSVSYNQSNNTFKLIKAPEFVVPLSYGTQFVVLSVSPSRTLS